MPVIHSVFLFLKQNWLKTFSYAFCKRGKSQLSDIQPSAAIIEFFSFCSNFHFGCKSVPSRASRQCAPVRKNFISYLIKV